ncbi:MAG: DUF2076 family protein, partial [Rhizobium sp.]
SFLRGALGTAAGVAGGVMLANSLSSLFSPHLSGTATSGLGGLFGGTAANAADQPAQETIINNNYFGNDDNNKDDGGVQNADYSPDDQDDDDYDDSSYDSGGDDSSFA